MCSFLDQKNSIIYKWFWLVIMNSSTFFSKQKYQKFGKEFASCVVMQLISFFLRKLVSCQSVELRPKQTACIYRGLKEEENMINFSPQYSRQW